MIRYGVYVRVSTVEQNLGSQRRELSEWVDRQGLMPGQVQWYEDIGSREKYDRTALLRLKSDVFQGKVKTVVVWKVDRLAGTLFGGLQLLQELLEHGVRVVSVTQEIDLSGTVGRMVAAILLGVSEIEMANRRERQMAGIEAGKAKGTLVYRGRQKGTTKVDPERAVELREKGFKAQEIAEALGVSRYTVYQYLKGAKGIPGKSARRFKGRK